MKRWRSGPWGVLGLVALLVIVLYAVGALEERAERDDPIEPSGEAEGDLPTELAWKHVELGPVRGTSLAPADLASGEGVGAYVAGTDGDRAALVEALPGQAVRAVDLGDIRLPDGEARVVAHGVVTAVTVTGKDGPDEQWFLGDYGDWQPLEGPQDDAGAPPDEVVVVPNDEDGYLGAVGLLGDRSRPTLAAWAGLEEWQRLDLEQLRLPRAPVADATGAGLIAATTETTVIAATQDDEGVTVHRIDAYGDTGSATSGRWRPVRIPPTLERVTGVAHWELGVWLVGHGDRRPRIVSCEGGPRCRELAAPDVLLDPAYPKVQMIGEPVAGPMVLALQTASGPQIWVDGPDGWAHFPAPHGRIGDGMVVGEELFLLVDGQLFTGRLPAALASSGD